MCSSRHEDDAKEGSGLVQMGSKSAGFQRLRIILYYIVLRDSPLAACCCFFRRALLGCTRHLNSQVELNSKFAF